MYATWLVLASKIMHVSESRARCHGWTVAHLDATLVCEGPKLGPHRDAMRERLAEATGLAPLHVNVKFTTNEGMGFVGRGEGIAALAVASVERGA